MEHGVMATLQILVLSFWVRVPMLQQSLTTKIKNIMVVAFLRMSPMHRAFSREGMSPIKGGEYNGYVAFDKELPQSW